MKQDKENKVYKFLLTPIKCSNIIILNKNGITSTQLYKSNFDPDMSDVAVKFYKILYGEDILDNGKLKSKEFAGDTMCSFNTVANLVPEAGKSKKQRTEYEKWPDYLKDYYDFYHCLANFWLLPMWVGRSYPTMPEQHKWASKSAFGDYMDRFLTLLNNDDSYEKFIDQYKSYGGKFPSFEAFVKGHYICGEINFVSDKYEVIKYSDTDDPEKIVESMEEKIRARASAISKDSIVCDKLYDWCTKLEDIL